MSGYNEISSWAFDNIHNFLDYDQFLAQLAQSFEDNGRAPLYEIFDESDYRRLESDFNSHYNPPVVESHYESQENEAINDMPEELGSGGFISKLKRFFGL